MNQPQCKFVDAALGSTAYRNNVLDIHDVKRRLSSPPKDCYITWHRFPELFREHVARTKSVQGYRGTSYSDFLPFDFDDSNGPEVSIVKTREFLQKLEVTYEVDGLNGVRCYFSGSKGFHILLSSALFGGWVPSPDLHTHLKSLALLMGKEFGIDPKIYDQNRLFRIPNTLHSTSGLYKIPLTSQEMLFSPVAEILKLAAEPRKIEFPDWDDCMPRPPCVTTWESIKRGQQGEKKKPKNNEPVFQTGLRDGEGRDEAAFRIARHLRDHGVSPQMAKEFLVLWDSTLSDSLIQTDGSDVFDKKIQNAYGTLETDERITPESLKTIAEMAAEYTAYIEAMKSRKVTLGLHGVDALLRGIAPGEVCTIMAKSGVGKTAFLQNVLLHISQHQKNILSVFCSMEQPLAQCFERWSQMCGTLSGPEVEETWQDMEGRGDLVKELISKIGDRVLTCGIPGLRMDELDKVVTMAEVKAGRAVHVLAVDYLGLLDTTDLDRTVYAQVSKAARNLKTLAKNRNISIFLLCQVNRMAGEEGDTPLTIHSARESGAIEESADFLLGLYRPEMKKEDEHITVQVLKNRKGRTGAFTYDFSRETLQITEPKEMFGPTPHDLERSMRGEAH